jgi:hypothetical protein
MLTQKTRQTRQCEIERTIHVERTDALRATITETRQLKTKTTSTSTAYRLRRFDSEIGGVGVEVVKLDGSGEVYDCLLHGLHGHECSCPHGTYRANSGVLCRHVLAALEAQKRGLL